MRKENRKTLAERRIVLVVDDDVNLLLTLTCLLNRKGIPARGASGARTALASLVDGRVGIGVVIAGTDVPAVNGASFLHHCRAEFPGLPIIAMSESPGALFADKGSFFAYLERPFQHEQLFNVVTLALEQAAARRREAAENAEDWIPEHALHEPALAHH